MSFSWTGRPCLVTGASGFGGSHLCGALLDRGAKVYGLDRVFPRNAYLSVSGAIDRVEPITGDIRDLDLMRLTLERYEIDTVFHAAAQPIAPMSVVLPLETLSINAQGTFTILEALRTTKCGARLVFASSGAIYGATTTDQPIAEDDPHAPPNNLYGPSKLGADIAVRAYANVYGIKAGVARFMNTYGPGDTNFSRIVPRAIKNLLTGAPYDFGDRDDGSTRLDFLHISDMTEAYLRLAERLDEVSGQAFNFGRGMPVSTREIATLVSRAFDGQDRVPAFRGAPRERPVVKYLNVAKANSRLDWSPRLSLEQGLRETVAWYREYYQRL